MELLDTTSSCASEPSNGDMLEPQGIAQAYLLNWKKGANIPSKFENLLNGPHKRMVTRRHGINLQGEKAKIFSKSSKDKFKIRMKI